MISHRLRSADDGLLAEGLRKRVPHRILSSPITLFARSLALARLMAQQDGARRHAGQRSLAVDFAKQEGAELIRIEDPRFARNGDRVKNRASIKGAVAQALKRKARAGSRMAMPIRMSASPPSYRLAPPSLGGHTDQILVAELGLSNGRIEELRPWEVI